MHGSLGQYEFPLANGKVSIGSAVLAQRVGVPNTDHATCAICSTRPHLALRRTSGTSFRLITSGYTNGSVRSHRSRHEITGILAPDRDSNAQSLGSQVGRVAIVLSSFMFERFVSVLISNWSDIAFRMCTFYRLISQDAMLSMLLQKDKSKQCDSNSSM